ncbi:MAG: hypothetical protein FWE40_07270 [Oscillospiraceae bacterium]|jgi:hypothetical protein|nr:hypothetical protein [Oscillospiraceae bacterium]
MILIFIGAIITALGQVLNGIAALTQGGTWYFFSPNFISVPAGVMALISFALAIFGVWQGFRSWQNALS